MQGRKGHTIVVIIVDQIVRSDHVHQTNDATMLNVLNRSSTRQIGDGIDTTIQSSILLKTNGSARNLELAITELNLVETLDDRIDNFVVGILTESNALDLVRHGKA